MIIYRSQVFLAFLIFLCGCKQQQEQSINTPPHDYTVSGIVTEEGNSIIEGAEVKIGNVVDHTDASGRYSLVVVPSGSDTIECTSTKDVYESFRIRISIGNADKIFNIALVPRRNIKFSELFKQHETISSVLVIDHDTILGKKHSPYIVDKCTHIRSTLTIDPGVILMMQSWIYLMPSPARIIAVGNVSEKISFIPYADSSWLISHVYNIGPIAISEFAYCFFSNYGYVDLYKSNVRFCKFQGERINFNDSMSVYDHITILPGVRIWNSYPKGIKISYLQVESPNPLFTITPDNSRCYISNSNILSGSLGGLITLSHCYLTQSVNIIDSSQITFESPSLIPISNAGCGW